MSEDTATAAATDTDIDGYGAEGHRPKPRIFQKGYLPQGIDRWSTNVAESVNVLRFPLGDIDNFRLSRAAYAHAQSKAAGSLHPWSIWAPWEKQYYEALSGVTYKASQGEMVSGQDGGYLAPEVWSQELWSLLRNFTVFGDMRMPEQPGMPVTRYTVPARITHFPKVTSDITVYYPGENAAITASQFKFGQLSYDPHKATALIYLSNEIMRDAPDFADQYLRRQAAEALAVDRDKQLLQGQGGLNPTGMIYNPAISTQYPASTTSINGTAAAAQPSYQNIGELIQFVENISSTSAHDAGQVRVNGAITNSWFKQTVWSGTNMQDTSHRPMWFDDLNAHGGMFGLTWGLTNLVPNNLTVAGNNNTSVIIAGAWEKYVLLECLQLGFDATLEAGTSTLGFAADETAVRIVHRYDGGPINPEAFAILAGTLI